MVIGADPSSTFTFGDFQLDCRARELKKRGRKVRVQDQPLQILSRLVAAAGEVVTRDELRAAVWEPHTHVDFDRGINKAINRGESVTVRVGMAPGHGTRRRRCATAARADGAVPRSADGCGRRGPGPRGRA